jgi:NAD(P)-dependent dehydrogenase (short-subunit alcohol dehydrogenase family)
MVSARNVHGLDSLVQQIRREGGEAMALGADVTDFEQVKHVADKTAELYGRIDTWVHAAAVALYAEFEKTTPEEFKRIIDVNLVGQAYGAMAALPHLRREGRGALIHISSVEARRAMPYHSAYAASKHGIEGFAEALRLELRHEGLPISVTNVMPGSINTPLFDKARTKIGVQPQGIPPIYDPEVVANAILYAAEHPVRDMIVGGAAKMIVMNQSLSPKLTDAIFLRIGFKGQQTDTPKAENAPNNLFMPIDGYNRAVGQFGDEAKPVSAYTWLQRNPAAKWAVSIVPLVVAGVLASTRMLKNA